MNQPVPLLNLFQVAQLLHEIRTYTPSKWSRVAPITPRMILARSLYCYAKTNHCEDWFTAFRKQINNTWESVEYALDLTVVPAYHEDIQNALIQKANELSRKT